MGVDLYLSAHYEDTEGFRKKKEAWRKCLEADVDPPEELDEMFGDREVLGLDDDLGLGPEVPYRTLMDAYTKDDQCTIVLDLQKLPDEVRYIVAMMRD